MFRFLMAVVQPLVSSPIQTIFKLRRIPFHQAVFSFQKRSKDLGSHKAQLYDVSGDICQLKELFSSGKSFQGRLTPEFVLDMLESLENDADTALFFFNWTCTQHYEHDSQSYNQLIRVLASASRIRDVECILREMTEKGFTVGYEIALELLVGYAEAGMVDRAQEIFDTLKRAGHTFPTRVYYTMFNAYEKLQRYEDMYNLLEELLKGGYVLSASTTQVLVQIFCKGNTVHKAIWLVNQKGVEVDVKSLSILVESLCKIGKEDTAVELCEEKWPLIEHRDNAFIFKSIVCGVVRSGGLVNASKVIRKVVQKGLLAGCISDYVFPEGEETFKFSDILLLFRGLKIEPGTFEYNSYIERLCRGDNLQEALTMYNLMRETGIRPDIHTYNYMVECICRAGRVEDAQKVLDAMEETDTKPDVFTYTRLINGFCRTGKLGATLDIYCRMRDAGCTPDFVTFGCMIGGFCKAEKFEEAVVILKASIDAGCEPDEVTYSSIIDPLCNLEQWESALTVFEVVRKRNCPGSVFLYSRLMNCLCKTSKVETACMLLQDMCNGENKSGQLLGGDVCEPTVVIYNILVDRLCVLGKVEEAFVVVRVMEERGIKPDVVTYTTFLRAFCELGRLDDACKLLETMVKVRCSPDTISYNTIVSSLCTAGREEEACGLLQVMIENGCEPNTFTYSYLIGYLCRSKRIEAAMHLFNYMKLSRCIPELNTYKDLIYGHYRCGKRREARRILEQESKSYSMNSPGKSLLSELHEAGNAYERKLLTSIVAQDRLQ